ncbi:MAG: 6-carboxytetrahydropterin synthase QueD [Candidatus Omnitrophica bacterium]|nr:6-carboxytetrahydropterin synthase QueD [Candidatus Omnitrophota bacterium]
MYRVKVESSFSAAHNLRAYKGKCEALHGHNWKIEVVAQSKELDNTGMVIDFSVLKKELQRILKQFDHAYLNKITPFTKINPTSENIAVFIYKQLKKSIPEVCAVTVWESPSSSATYYEQTEQNI